MIISNWDAEGAVGGPGSPVVDCLTARPVLCFVLGTFNSISGYHSALPLLVPSNREERKIIGHLPPLPVASPYPSQTVPICQYYS